RSLFASNEDQVLELFPPQIHDGLVTIKPPVDVIEEGVQKCYAASALGKPLYMDGITVSQQRLAFDKVCVEIVVGFMIPKSIDVELNDRPVVSVGVDVSWMPHFCSFCNSFRHPDKGCPHKEKGKVRRLLVLIWLILVLSQMLLRFDVFNLELDDCDGFNDVPALDEASKQMIHSPKKPRVASKEVVIDV
ncbi:hypothetical protein Gorai_004661, partial [Gossypium raimondii]|nr:hypothetical protein [Gossypium raimondii]